MAKNLKKPATEFHQTTRKGWVLSLTTEELINILPSRGPEQLTFLTETNRAIAPKHLDDIQDFLYETPSWALPSLTLAAVPEAISLNRGCIELDHQNLKILDGQHRLEAISNLIHHWKLKQDQDPEAKDKLDYFRSQQIPVTVFEVQNDQEQRQLFAWFAKSRQIESAVRDYFDNSDPYNQIAKDLMTESITLQDNVTWKSKTVPVKEKYLMSLANVKDIIAAIHLGIERAPKKDDTAALADLATQQSVKHKTIRFLDDFLPECSPNYHILSDLKNLSANTLSSKSTSYALEPRLIRLFANTWARWTEDASHPTEDVMANTIGNLNLNKASPENDVDFTLNLTTEKRRFYPPRHSCWHQATLTLLNKARGIDPPQPVTTPIELSNPELTNPIPT